jgi:catalase-peroxidase
MGLGTFGFGFGREDIFEPEEIFWGPEDTWLGDERYSGERELAKPLGSVQMGLIYVNPEGPNGNPDPLAAAKDIRETFARMAMNDEETLALIIGGHTFGKTHGAADPEDIGPEPEAAPMEQQLIGWKNSHGTGVGVDALTSGLEGAWTNEPTKWDNGFLENLFAYDWELTKSPAGAHQWTPKNPEAQDTVPDAHDPSKRHAPMMLTTDLALKLDPIYEPIARRFYENSDELADAFGKAWYKLLHRDMGPITRVLGPSVPEAQLWQDPVPAHEGPLVSAADIAALKQKVLSAGLSVPQLVSTAWAAAACFRGTDKRGGANGARIRLEPQRSWEVNDPTELAKVLASLEEIAADFNAGSGAKISLADLIVLAGTVAVEKAAKDGGVELSVGFTPGRTDATQELTDVESFAVLEPKADGFRNYARVGDKMPAEVRLLDKANLMCLTPSEMTVLVGGLRVLGANHQGSAHGVFTEKVGTLSNAFFVNLLDVGTVWSPASAGEGLYEGRNGDAVATATAADLVFGSNSVLRAIAEVYAQGDAKEKFARDFAAAWTKVMELDRYDLVR